MDKCEKCGGEIRVGDWPYCGGDPSKHVHMDRFGEDPIEPYFDEMLSTDGEHITTRSQRRKIMDKNAIVPKDNPYRNVIKGRRLFFDMARRG